ncbi:corticosteroid-binding globulin [Perognathus longimembris pacificus]|uniref:corticosteroid-binding globulin n=1 Tax=Perognathus longimembris pacificus TaxID=214514 RepID=UPI0020195BF1|nr:corticosteroid-binding globulin [Perognathus longimembris pacificus]
MPFILCTCLLWLSTIQAQDLSATVSTIGPHRGLAPTNLDFAFNLYQHLVASAPDKNVFISPVSISMALAMLSLGASGHTQTQLLQGLGFNLTQTTESEIHQGFQHLHHLLGEANTGLDITMGRALFLDQTLRLLESFSADIKHYYESEALATDFKDWAGASRQINDYVENKTKGRIKDVLSDPGSPTKLILVDYVFFKGIWAYAFGPENIRDMDFHVSEKVTVRVPMMFQLSTVKYLHDTELPCQLVQMDYVGNGTVFFILPEPGRIDTVIAGLKRSTIERWASSLSPRLMSIIIPKMSISGTYDLGGVLAEMGITDMSPGHGNFSEITQATPLERSKIVHKAMLHLKEKGRKPLDPRKVTKNTASKIPTFILNRPFLILVFDDFTWSSLFLGKVVNPI